VLSTIFNKDSVNNGLNYLLGKKNSAGSDGVMLHDLKEYMEKHPIAAQVIDGSYAPKPALSFDIPSKSGKTRTVYKLCASDRLVCRVLQEWLSREYDYIFSPHCISYREGYGITSCCDVVRSAVDQNLTFVTKIDISSYFESIRHELLIPQIKEIISDSDVMLLVEKLLQIPIEKDYRVTPCEKGLIQGNPVSPFFANLFLSDFDHYIHENITQCFYRYADDIAMFFPDAQSALSAMETCRSALKETYYLQINEKKSGVYPISSKTYLGYTLVESKNHKYEIVKYQKEKHVYSSWKQSGLRATGEDIEIVSNGILSAEEATLVFENDNLKRHFPIQSIHNINIYSEVTINSTALKYVSDNSLCLTVFDKHGAIIGRLIPTTHAKRADVFLKQAEIYIDQTRRLAMAKAFIEAELFNLRTNLRYYAKHSDAMSLTNAVEEIGSLLDSLKEETQYARALLLEARGREQYYGCLNDILPDDDFEFQKRIRQPPKDAINALISFGNVVMYNYISNEIQKTSMDVKIGYLHATNRRSESLNLDVAEIFKPVITDRVIFSMINKHILNEHIHFEEDENKTWLTSEGKRLFLRSFHDKINSEITMDGRKMSYSSLIWRELMRLQNYLCGDSKTYKPYHHNL